MKTKKVFIENLYKIPDGIMIKFFKQFKRKRNERLREQPPITSTNLTKTELKMSKSDSTKEPQKDKHLYRDKHKQGDMFVANLVDVSLKDDRFSMEHQIYGLSKAKVFKKFTYEHNGNTLEVKPSTDGIPLMKDKNILIYAASQLATAINKGRAPERTIKMTVFDFLKATNKGTGGEDYYQFLRSLDRLQGTTLKTNIMTGNKLQTKAFGILDSYEVIEYSIDRKTGKTNKKSATTVEITLSKWQYNAILSGELLTLNDNYFRLKSPTHMAIYLQIRKHCGKQGKWKVNLKTFQKKIGHKGELYKLRKIVKALSDKGGLLEYAISIDNDMLTVYSKNQKGILAQAKDLVSKINPSLVKHVKKDNIITAEDIERVDRVYHQMLKDGVDEAIASNIRDKMLKGDD